MTEKDFERMLNHKSIQTEIIEHFNEREDEFVFEMILPFCEQTAKREISKADLQEAITVWLAYKDGKIVWQKVGKWIEKDGWDGDVYYDCSVCGESWTTIEGTPWDNDMNYCPHCGAKMEGTEE